ncbi:hypothetical protein Dimus_023425 [Dionaea muscipula]
MATENAAVNRFPEGMRVLVVDDDLTCLQLLEKLLKRCNYDVTTTDQAVCALNLLKENQFDLVISDVHMPDMDGFELLRSVGLDSNIPVIMLSAYDDPKLVMNGLRHGAVDYLIKPVRIQELKNIWQHVLRKNIEGRKEPASAVDVPLSRKRKGSCDHEEDEEDERDDDSPENENPASGALKKRRITWTKYLHDKFVSAVEQLGPDKAFPKKILELMKVEGLTRENVASHLQKYRLFLKKLNDGSSPPMNNYMANSLGGRDIGVNRNSLVGLGKIRAAAGAGGLTSSYQPGGMLGRLNTASGHVDLRAAGRLTSSYQPGGMLGRLNTGAGHVDHLRQQATACGPTFNSSFSSFGNSHSDQPLSSFPNQNTNPFLHGILLQQHQHPLYNKYARPRGVNRDPDDHKPAISGFAARDHVCTKMPHGSTSSIGNGTTLLGPSRNSTGNPSLFNIPHNTSFCEPFGGFWSRGTNLMMAYQDKYNNRNWWSGALQSSSVPVDSYYNFIGGIGVESDPMEDNLPMPSLEDMHIQGDGDLAYARPSSNGIPVVHAGGSFGQNGAALAYDGNIHGYSVFWPNDATPGPSPVLQQNEIPGWENGSKPRLVDNFMDETSTILEGFNQNRCESLEDILGSSQDGISKRL